MSESTFTLTVAALSSRQKSIENTAPRNQSSIAFLCKNLQLGEAGTQSKKNEARSSSEGQLYVRQCSSENKVADCEPSLRPIIRRRRAKSLPCSLERKTPAGPGRSLCQHRVRFADSLGLDLTEVRVFRSAEDPSVPLHVLTRLALNSDLRFDQDLNLCVHYLEPDFSQQPIDSGDFWERLQRQKVCLERALRSETGFTGTIRVLNVAYEKRVVVRYTFTEWQSCHETAATWEQNSAGTGSDSDQFKFSLQVPPFILEASSGLQFAIRYQVLMQEYWDNNDGNNYSMVCRSHFVKLPKQDEDNWIHFI
ncbi:protein phosphatase 1 regulatory subunit 3D [Latimeria chalumnae]|uniref:Protein phosphatase 1 regulatory subunit 3D n=1 Tax=Latimeria chalumnae TaxID=7897 RepID=H3BBZ8_LATCH|nr:PREDICTED: protein phosphatase 1 regulatory subunit 3D [Latimeria chalumnae]|eukprot:XP_005993641.1 PREDICTED: protein phosphatase 1 regulatory subunit 3D [Latimeria chalumnae]